MPGPGEPDESAELELRVSTTGIDATATGATTVGTPNGRIGQVVAVIVTANTASDFSFNVTEAGSNVFTSAQSPSSTGESTFLPDAEARHFEAAAGQIQFSVTSASTSGATADVTVVVAVAEQT